MAETTTPVTSVKDLAKGPQGEALRWLTEIKLFERESKTFSERCEKIVRRYRNGSVKDIADTSEGSVGRRFNMLWANIQTLQPTIFSKAPKADVQRRNKDKDPVGRMAAEIAERVLDYFIDREAYMQAIKNARDDFLIVGQGIHWHRYVPHFRDVEYRVDVPEVQGEGPQITNTADSESEGGEEGEAPAPQEGETVQSDERGQFVMRQGQEIDFEEVVTDYVNWKDFGRSPGARTWAEVGAVWRKTYLTRDELVARFGKEKGDGVALDYAPPKNDTDGNNKTVERKATIYEIADKGSKQFIWVARDYSGDVLDRRDDPLKIDGFFPCQPPLFANLTTNTLLPVPDYLQYQDQADEMDALTEKIYKIMEAIRVRGLYAGNLPELSKLLADSGDLDFTPVDQSVMAMLNGDISKSVWIWPLDVLVAAMDQLIMARDKVKQDSYEITGISDIVRGASDPRETLGAQQIKTQTGSIRIRDRQQDMARFIRDGLRIDFDIVVNHFQTDTIARIADIKSIPEAAFIQGPDGVWRDPKEIAAMMQPQPAPGGGSAPVPPQAGAAPLTPAAPQAGGSVPSIPPPPLPQGPTLGEAAIALLKDTTERRFRIDIETDSTIEVDQAQEKADRTEFITAVSTFVQAWAPVLQQTPQLGALAGELLMFAVRGFKAGSQLEGVIEAAMEDLQRAAKNPPPPPPDPAMVKAQADAAATQQAAQIQAQQAQAEGQREAQSHQQQMAIDQQKAQAEMAAEAQRGQIKKMLAAMEAQSKQIDLLIAQVGLQTARAQAAKAAQPNGAGE